MERKLPITESALEPNSTSTATTTATSTAPNTGHCYSWRSGHQVHYIQGMRASRDSEPGHYVACKVVEASADGQFTVVISATGDELRLWNHDPGRVRSLLHLDRLEINVRWSVLRRRRVGGSDTFVSVHTKPSPCVFEDPMEEFRRGMVERHARDAAEPSTDSDERREEFVEDP